MYSRLGNNQKPCQESFTKGVFVRILDTAAQPRKGDLCPEKYLYYTVTSIQCTYQQETIMICFMQPHMFLSVCICDAFIFFILNGRQTINYFVYISIRVKQICEHKGIECLEIVCTSSTAMPNITITYQ